ncbi:unnamed protein product [Meloidogyne enterolobii]|uniref:Uncharacterized protein n=1 Tax=Meloidogyne enterolobii TaxID=390850 RepID=A0ACB0Y5F5_MELEN
MGKKIVYPLITTLGNYCFNLSLEGVTKRGGCFALFCLFFLLIIGTIALFTDFALFYRLLNIIPFNEFPGQSTVALSAESLARVYAFLFLYFLTFLLQFWFIKIIYNCNRYFAERNNYMLYCLAYSTPLKTLNSAR